MEEQIKRFDRGLKSQNVSLTDQALLMYSSGTTGNPKGILLTHSNIFYEAYGMAKHYAFDETTVYLLNLPLFFSGGVFPSFFSPLLNGGSFVLARRFSKSRFWDVMSRYKVTNTYCVPTML